MAQITINITNKCSDGKFFLTAMNPPTRGSGSKIFTNAYLTTPTIVAERDGSSSATFSFTTEWYAIYGTSSNSRSATTVQTSSFKKVHLGPGGSVVAITNKNGAVDWDDEATAGKTCDAEGGFRFDTDNTISGDDNPNLYIGLGGPDPNRPGKVIPLATYAAEPALSSQIFPKMVYYVVQGEFHSGQVVDWAGFGRWVKIDFEGCRNHTVNITLGQDGRWADDDEGASKVKLSNEDGEPLQGA